IRSAIGMNSRKTSAPPKTMTSGASPARRRASSGVRATVTPGAAKAGSRVRTMFVRSGRARPMDSYVRRPMMTGLPTVSARTFLMSSGSRQGSLPPLPMTFLRSNATTEAIRPTPPSSRAAPRAARPVRHAVEEQRVFRDGEGHAEEQVGRALEHEERKPVAFAEELEHRVAGRKRRGLELARVPRGHHHPPARRIPPQQPDHVRELIDATPVGGDPVAPLLTVVSARVALEPRALAPVRRVRVPVPDVDAERVQLPYVGGAVQEPEELGDDRAEREALRGHGGEAVAHPEAHDLADARARAHAGAVLPDRGLGHP